MVPSISACAALLPLLFSLSSLARAALTLDRPRQPHQPTGNGDRLLSYNETTPRPTFRPSFTSVQWSEAGHDGEYISKNEAGDLILEDIVSGESHVFIPSNALPEGLHDYWIGSDRNTVLLATNYTKQYRHSYFSNYFLLDAGSNKSVPLVEDQAGDIQYAVLSPDTRSVAFVRGNNVFVRDSDGGVHQITDNGGPDMFNGIPDWVYEEEIFADRSTLWFSPDSKYIAFLSFNETGVRTFSIPYFMEKHKIAPTYPFELNLRYPKVGTPNPTVQFSILDVGTREHSVIPVDAFGSDTIIGEVAWVTDAHSAVIYRAFNRPQDLEKHILVDPEAKTGKVVRERDGTDGWLDNTVAITYVGKVNDDERTYYVDLSDESGWMHIYLYPVNGGEPVQLTSGDWEVDSILHVDGVRKLIYYSATTHHSTERHIYSVSFATKRVTALVDDGVPAVWTASFSSEGGFYILTYMGPDVPYQELHSTDPADRQPLRTLTTNEEYYSKIDEYNLPNITYFELKHPDGFTLNVMQQRPPNFNESRKYPSLFTPYGGPNSQSVLKAFHSHNWNAYISSEPELQFVTYTVDNRGTGFKGRKFRSAVSRQLGALEPRDQIWAAQELLARHEFLDSHKVGMWGWSFGGFLTAKTVEQDSGVFTLGLSTAPVSDWRFYDTMYTERYMKTLEANERGYGETAVRRAEGFKNIEGVFALMHGTGDDNVHFQNAAALVDLLVGEGVSPRKFKMMAFTDSDHSINYHGGSEFIYKFLTERLWEEVRRVPGRALKHQWYRKGLDRLA